MYTLYIRAEVGLRGSVERVNDLQDLGGPFPLHFLRPEHFNNPEEIHQY